MKTSTWIMISLLIVVLLLIGFNKPIKKLMTRGYINKNPGNIRHDGTTWQGEVSGKDKDFKSFKSMAYGYRALFVNLRTYITKHNLNTIRSIISVYAPTNENNTQAYISSVSQRTGLSPDAPIAVGSSQFIDLVEAISYHENGIKPDMSDINAGYNLFKTT
jgi:hypothetical protein